MTDKPKWDLEEVPFHQFPNETNDPAGGWYLHFEREPDHEVLYMSKSNVSEKQAKLIAAAPELLQALRCALADLEGSLAGYGEHDWDAHVKSIKEARLAISKATGE